MWERTTHRRSQYRSKRSVEPPWNPLSAQLRESLQTHQQTIYHLSEVTGVDGTYIWRIVRGEQVEVSREVLILIALALVLDKETFAKVVQVLNLTLHAGGFRQLPFK
jgi:hypothetical protein